MNSVNPVNQKIIACFEEDDSHSIHQKISLLQEGFISWSKISLKERIRFIGKFSDLLLAETERIALDLTLETGKPLQESKNEISGAIKKIRFFLKESGKYINDQSVHIDERTEEFISYEPLGVLCHISAWNYPYLVGINIFIPAIIAGNCVLYKPSEFALKTGENITKLFYQAGIPANVFQMIIGDGKQGKFMLEHEFDGYYFTGSYQTGKAILDQISSRLKPMVFEMGGKDCVYITEDINDIVSVASSCVEGAFYNNGQSCCSLERIYVHEKIYDNFIEAFIEKTRELTYGDPLEKKNTQGALTRASHHQFLIDQIKDALEKGAKLETGGASQNPYFEPTVLVDVNHQMKIMKEESFGPVIGVMKVKDDEEAIKLMNDSSYGLTAAVYINNLERGKKILTQVKSGTSYINCCDRVSGYLPWRGEKNSGYGTSLSMHGLYSFCQPRAWHIRS